MEGSDFVVAEQDMGILNLHLISGEDIIGRVFIKEDLLVVQKPVIPNVGMQQTDGGRVRVSIGVLPMRPYIADEEIEIPAARVMWTAKITKNMEDVYTQFTSNITLAPANALPDLRG